MCILYEHTHYFLYPLFVFQGKWDMGYMVHMLLLCTMCWWCKWVIRVLTIFWHYMHKTELAPIWCILIHLVLPNTWWTHSPILDTKKTEKCTVPVCSFLSSLDGWWGVVCHVCGHTWSQSHLQWNNTLDDAFCDGRFPVCVFYWDIPPSARWWTNLSYASRSAWGRLYILLLILPITIPLYTRLYNLYLSIYWVEALRWEWACTHTWP